MARTMAANLTGARLREVDQALRNARGGAAVDALMKAHPHEARVLQHLFQERRDGRPAPPLARIVRVMVWSDGAMEFRLVDGPVAANVTGAALAGHASRPAPGRPAFQAGSSMPGGQPLASRSAQPPGPGRPLEGDRGRAASRASGPVGPAPGPRTAWVGGGRLEPVPRQYRRRGGDVDDVGWGTAPRGGEGWSVVRPGEVLPMDPGDPEEYAATVPNPVGVASQAGTGDDPPGEPATTAVGNAGGGEVDREGGRVEDEDDCLPAPGEGALDAAPDPTASAGSRAAGGPATPPAGAEPDGVGGSATCEVGVVPPGPVASADHAPPAADVAGAIAAGTATAAARSEEEARDARLEPDDEEALEVNRP